jgi:hypothetical protein
MSDDDVIRDPVGRVILRPTEPMIGVLGPGPYPQMTVEECRARLALPPQVDLSPVHRVIRHLSDKRAREVERLARALIAERMAEGETMQQAIAGCIAVDRDGAVTVERIEDHTVEEEPLDSGRWVHSVVGDGVECWMLDANPRGLQLLGPGRDGDGGWTVETSTMPRRSSAHDRPGQKIKRPGPRRANSRRGAVAHHRSRGLSPEHRQSSTRIGYTLGTRDL